MDDLSTGSESDYNNSWISWFLSTKGNWLGGVVNTPGFLPTCCYASPETALSRLGVDTDDSPSLATTPLSSSKATSYPDVRFSANMQEYFAEVDEDYILDRFNLTGLNGEVVQEYQRALDLITDCLDGPKEGAAHTPLPSFVRLESSSKGDFGRCPRVYCYGQNLLPVGLTDIPYQKAVKLYCPRCEDIYSPKSNRHGSIDGAYFGTTFPHMLFMAYPQMIPSKGQPSSDREMRREPVGPGGVSSAAAALKAERYEPKIFGFRVHEEAQLHRWRTAKRDDQIQRLENLDSNNNNNNNKL
ncbi:hypothetical protein A1Q2_07242 [Trichosporon asahii var. asahii CBS 8904]|uniref:Casein kinase II subunit beta n=1 Tax=Trichosporon asahii var. asahii (strain CBS 8904) TaxID=1220162 RepID=K1V3D1_TRIAC|nr:hypothetical protein A1Q2_07242 [Trichosporon asahii var. asahii CBS 8904]